MLTAGLGTCCAKPVLSDWSKDDLLNKRCAACGTRWFGRGEDARVFTRREWDAWIEADAARERAEIEARNKAFFLERSAAHMCANCSHFLQHQIGGMTGTCEQSRELMKSDEGRGCLTFKGPN